MTAQGPGFAASVAARKKTTGTPCPIPLLLASMIDRGLAKEVADTIEGKTLRASDIARELRDRGYSINEDQVTYHRRRDCQCPK